MLVFILYAKRSLRQNNRKGDQARVMIWSFTGDWVSVTRNSEYSHHRGSGLEPIKLVVINPLDIGVGLEASHAVVR